jgi:hypothetical protein
VIPQNHTAAPAAPRLPVSRRAVRSAPSLELGAVVSSPHEQSPPR